MTVHFEWDKAKSARNLEKHGLSLEHGSSIFEGPTLDMPDRRGPYGEVRVMSLGRSGPQALFVAWTRRGESIRLISVRKANARETKRYEQWIESREGVADNS